MLQNNESEDRDFGVELATADCAAELQRVEVQHLLVEVHQLLEEYAPAWYSTELHEKLQAAVESQRG